MTESSKPRDPLPARSSEEGKQAISADVLLDALALRHSGDVFVPECKNGPTHGASHRRFDAWVLLKTWSPVTSIGYEIKVSRSDWRRDTKIEEYLPLCHRFFIVAPKGIVPMEELPEGVGLLEMVGQHQRLVMRRKAVRRDIDLPEDLMVYVLMFRAQIAREFQRDNQWRIDTLRAWTKAKDDRTDLSSAVNEKIRKRFSDQEDRNAALQRQIGLFTNIRARITELGFDPDQEVSRWPVEDRLRKLSGVVDTNTEIRIDAAIRELQRVKEQFETIRKSTAPALEVA